MYTQGVSKMRVLILTRYSAIEKLNRDVVNLLEFDSFGKNWGAKNLEQLLRILENVIEKKFHKLPSSCTG
jgi:hypothetical protein